jgi:O-antigen ligase
MESVEKPFIETFGFYPIVVIPLSFYLFLLFVAISVQHFGGIIFFGLSSFLFLTGSIARIKILRDGVVIERLVFGKS